MAKFNDKDLRLKDGEKITLGTDLDANLWYDGVANQLSVDTTVSGVTPTEGYHLTTKQYVDDGISTLSGSLIFDHGALTGLDDDDHTQYIRVDGTRGFTNTISGIDPITSSDLVTKGYVDTRLSSSTFLGLTDSPDIYTGYENYYVKVNAEGSALEFIAPNVIQEGITNLIMGTSSISINIGITLPSSDYTLTISLENKVDIEPSIYPTLIRDKTNDSFTVDFSGEIDSDNYYLDWRISQSSVGSGLSVSDGSITFNKMVDIPPSSFIGRNTTTSGIPEVLSVDTVKTMLGIGSNSGGGTSTEDVIALIIALGG